MRLLVVILFIITLVSCGGDNEGIKEIVPGGVPEQSVIPNPLLPTIDSVQNDTLFYVTNDNKPIALFNNGAFNANVVANVVENGVGMLIFDSKLVRIEKLAFASIENLTEIVIPSSVSFVGEGLFSGCTNLSSIRVEDENQLYSSCNGANVIVDIVNNKLVAGCNTSVIPDFIDTIGVASFSGSRIREILLPKSVKCIEPEAFAYCDELSSVIISDSLTTIAENSFYGCSLTEIILPHSIKSIEPGAFAYNNLAKMYIQASPPPLIDGNVFIGNSNLQHIYVPESWLDVYKEDFCWIGYADLIYGYEFSDLDIEPPFKPNAPKVTKLYYTTTDGLPIVPTSNPNFANALLISHTYDSVGCMTFKGALTEIGTSAFSNCYNLKTVEIPESVEKIGNCAFLFINGLEEFRVPAGVKSIGGDVVAGCDNLKRIVVDEDNKFFDSRGDCNAIINSETNTLIVGCKNTVIPDGVVKIDRYAFMLSRDLYEINIPEGVKEIGLQAFLNTYRLSKVTLPQTLEIIGNDCFAHAGIEEIILPASLKTIGRGAFADCSKLRTVYCMAKTPPELLDGAVFANTALEVVYVPKESIYLYRGAKWWSQFKCLPAYSANESATITRSPVAP